VCLEYKILFICYFFFCFSFVDNLGVSAVNVSTILYFVYLSITDRYFTKLHISHATGWPSLKGIRLKFSAAKGWPYVVIS
jgi:hypothetical protein